MTEQPAAPAVDDRQNALHGLIRRHVRVRFALTAQRFAERLLELASRAQASVEDHAARLSLDDLYLATACAGGDEGAWTECADSHFRFIRDFARKFLDDAAARDLADQVIADLWQRGKIGRYEGRSTLRTWLGTVVANAAMNASRGRHTLALAVDRDSDRLPILREVRPDTAAPEDDAAGRELAGLIARSVEALAPEEKVLLQLYYEQGLTLDEMEVAVRLSKATLSRRLKRIREQLRESVDSLARRSFGASADALRDRIELDRIEIDLASLLAAGGPVKETGNRRV